MYDKLAAADVRDPLVRPLAAAGAHVWRADPRGGPLLARLVGRVWARLPGRRARELAAAVRETMAAIRASAEWERARIVALEELVASLAATATPRPWLGAGERPFLLVGTGGGGTRILGEAALRLGVGLGPRVNESFDSVAWAPLVYEMILDGASARGRILEHAREVHAGWAFGDRPWGIKLPELTLVLPRFLEAFPAARVVFLARHPVTAALRRHHVTSTLEHPIGRRVLEEAYRAAGRDPSSAARDAQHIRNALSWRLQIGRVLGALEALPPAQVLRLRFEDFARNAAGTTARLAAFVERPMRADAIARIDGSRLGEVTRADRRAAEVMDLCGPTARALGYLP